MSLENTNPEKVTITAATVDKLNRRIAVWIAVGYVVKELSLSSGCGSHTAILIRGESTFDSLVINIGPVTEQ